MAGNMGNEQVTIKNLQVVSVDGKTNTVMVAGLVPGLVGGFVTVVKMGSKKNPVALLKNTAEAKIAAEEAAIAEAEAAKVQAEAERIAADEAAKAPAIVEGTEETQGTKETEGTEESAPVESTAKVVEEEVAPEEAKTVDIKEETKEENK